MHIIAGIQTEDKLPEEFIIKKIGIGAGKRKYDIPNVVRAMMIEVMFPSSKFTIYLFQNRTARSIIKLMTNTI